MVALVDLLARGYFPKELPPPFKTDEFAAALSNQTANISQHFLQNPKPHQHSAWCNHNLARVGGLRRNLAIPNPAHFYLLAHHVEAHWAHLQQVAHSSPYSLSKPLTSSDGRAIVPEHDLGERPAQRASLRVGARFVLQADISRFFPSIYTHSLPWALLGKGQAKQMHHAKKLKRTWQDSVDVYCRSLNRNQTVGIPIGPDTSRVMAEVVLGRIDQELHQKMPNIRGIRYIDDYEFAAETRSEAETILSSLQELLAHYELALNGTKTRIVELPSPFDAHWMSAIRCFNFRAGGATMQKFDLIDYFDIVFDLFKRYPEEGLLKYAIARLNGVNVVQDNWEMFQNILNQCVMVEPSCIQQVCNQVAHYTAWWVGFTPELGIWEATLNQVICERLPVGHASEAAWAMWLLKMLGGHLTDRSISVIEASDDSAAALMGFGLVHSGLGPASPTASLSGLRRFAVPSELFEDRWLLCYQGSVMNWFDPTSQSGILQYDARFQSLASMNVSFFDMNVPHPVPVRSAPGGGGSGGY
jgi:hypothetical protein